VRKGPKAQVETGSINDEQRLGEPVFLLEFSKVAQANAQWDHSLLRKVASLLCECQCTGDCSDADSMSNNRCLRWRRPPLALREKLVIQSGMKLSLRYTGLTLCFVSP
jgi:hypothetical protein